MNLELMITPGRGWLQPKGNKAPGERISEELEGGGGLGGRDEMESGQSNILQK